MKPQKTPDKQHAYKLFLTNRFMESGSCYQQITNQNPDDDEAWLMQGLCLQKLGKPDQAIHCLRRAITINPKSAKAYNHLGQIWFEKGMPDRAIINLRNAISLKKNYTDAHKYMIMALLALSRYHEAIKQCRIAIKYAPSEADLFCQLAVAYEQTHQLDKARKAAEKALKKNPELVRASLILAKLDKRSGNLEAARFRLMTELKKQLPHLQIATLAAELGDVLDRIGNYDAAYSSFETGNQILAQTITTEQESQPSIFDQITRHENYFTSELTKHWANDKPDDGLPTPIFLVGFPRSGTTLTEQILSTLDTIKPTDEKPMLSRLISEIPALLNRPFRYPEDLGTLTSNEIQNLRSRYWALVDAMIGSPDKGQKLLDKLPLNILDLGLVYRLFPDARVIVVLRDPRDCCLSCFMQPFKLNQSMVNFLSIDTTAIFYAATMKLLKQYQSVLGLQYHTVRYEDMVTDLEAEARKLLKFCDESWDDTVLRYFEHARERDVSTPSYSAVASPIYAKARGRWKNYSKQLQPVLPILESYIEGFGYNQGE